MIWSMAIMVDSVFRWANRSRISICVVEGLGLMLLRVSCSIASGSECSIFFCFKNVKRFLPTVVKLTRKTQYIVKHLNAKHYR